MVFLVIFSPWYSFIPSFLTRICLLIRERWRTREKHWCERNVDVREKHWKVASRKHPSQDRTCNLDGCPAWPGNHTHNLLVHGTTLQPAEPPDQDFSLIFFKKGFIYLLLERGEAGRERGRETLIGWFPLVCVLTGDWLQPRPVPWPESNPKPFTLPKIPDHLSHTCQDFALIFKYRIIVNIFLTVFWKLALKISKSIAFINQTQTSSWGLLLTVCRREEAELFFSFLNCFNIF